MSPQQREQIRLRLERNQSNVVTRPEVVTQMVTPVVTERGNQLITLAQYYDDLKRQNPDVLEMLNRPGLAVKAKRDRAAYMREYRAKQKAK